MSLEWAESLFDLKEDSPGMKRLGAEGSQNPSYRYPFKMLALDGVTISNPDIVLVPDKVSGRHHCRFCGPDLILGMGVLRQLHLYIAYKEKRLYVTAATAH
jgi:hypothetical protein